MLNAYTLTFGGLLLLGARAGDLLGRRRTFLTGIAIFTVASLVGGFATTGWFLLPARALQGVGGALAAPSSLALLTTMFPEGRERMRAIGAVHRGVDRRRRDRPDRRRHAHRVGVLALGAVRQRPDRPGGARWSAGSVLPETERQHGRFDLAGALTSTLGMSALVYGFVRAATDGWSRCRHHRFVRCSAWCCWPPSSASSCAPRSRSRRCGCSTDASRSGANVARGLLFAGMFGMFFFLTQFLQDVLGYQPAAGRLRLPAGADLGVRLVAAGQPGAGRTGSTARLLMLIGVGLSTIGLAVGQPARARTRPTRTSWSAWCCSGWATGCRS